MGAAVLLQPDGEMNGADEAPLRHGQLAAMQTPARNLLVLFDVGQVEIVQLFADVLGQACVVAEGLDQGALHSDRVVVGLDNHAISPAMLGATTRSDRTVITTHALDAQDLRDEDLTDHCDYEYIYTKSDLTRRDVARFVGFVLGQSQFHQHIMGLPRSNVLSLNVPNVRSALANADILTVGVDAIELRVDMLEDTSPLGRPGCVPDLKFVGEQVMALRQVTALPIIFTARSSRGKGRFPAHEHVRLYTYLRKAIQWGCEYIDVELWLPEEARIRIADYRGSSKIISTYQDFSGAFRWESTDAYRLFEQCAMHSDIVRMEAMGERKEDHEELEAFRAMVAMRYPDRPLCGLNISGSGRPHLLSNTVLTPHGHHLAPSPTTDLPSVAETYLELRDLGRLASQEIWAIGHVASATIRTGFFEKCINEIGLDCPLRCTEQSSLSYLEAAEAAASEQSTFGGAWLDPPREVASFRTATPSESAKQIGFADTMTATPSRIRSGKALLQVDNIAWKAIRCTLTHDLLPCAFEGRHAVLVGDGQHMETCLAAIYALRSLNVKVIHSVGFKPPAGPLASCVRYIGGVAAMEDVQDAVAVVSVLSPSRAHAVAPLLKFFCNGTRKPARQGKLFIDLLQAKGNTSMSGDKHKLTVRPCSKRSSIINGNSMQSFSSLALATDLGWTVYGADDVRAWTTVEMAKRLLNHDLGFDFVRRYS